MYSVISQIKRNFTLKFVTFCCAIFILSSISNNALALKKTISTYAVTVLDKNEIPIPNVVIEFHLSASDNHASDIDSVEKVAIMDQLQEQFKPHILTIEKGTLVSFPNSDNIKHHIYSFSEAKSFEQGLYKGKQALPINFDNPGVVDLGCNIHDWMLGYIYIAESRHFATTNNKGQVSLAIPFGIKSISAWHPRMQEADRRLMLRPQSGETTIVFRLANDMRDDIEGYEDLQLDVY